MSNPLEPEVKTNPQGDPITSVEPEQKTNPQGDPITSAAPIKVGGSSKDPHEGAKKQRVVTPEHMFFEAPRKREFITGSEAAKEAVRRSNVDFSVAYPITPQSETMQLIGVLYGEGYVKEYYRGEEEYGVMSAIAGGSRAGVRCFTATAGPGTLRGIEPIASWPGHRLPAVAMFTCRVVNAPLAIQPDNIEISYLLNCGMIVIHAVWQQEVWAAVERSRRYIEQYMGGLCAPENVEGAEALIVASGSAAAQSREAIRLCKDQGVNVGFIKIRSLRPFPTKELRQLCVKAKLIVIPEFNYVGWLAKDVAAAIYGYSNAKVVAGPHVYGGMSMPVEMIVDEVIGGLTGKKSIAVPDSAIMGRDVNQAEVAHFMQNI